MKLTLTLTLTTLATLLATLLPLIHAAPSTIPNTTLSLPSHNHQAHPKRAKKKDKESCIKVTLADGTTWDRFCKPPHTCIKIKSPEQAPVAFEMPASTVCTLFRGGAGNMDKMDGWCHGTPRDFEGGDRDLRPLPIWDVRNSKGWACYDRA